MIQHGIHTSGADFWVHLHPLEKPAPAIYWYAVRHMREHLTNVVALTNGKSKDGTVTGNGVLVKKNEPFIRRVNMPTAIAEYFDWGNGTDRQAGLLWGEQAMDWLLSTAQLQIPFFTASRLQGRRQQIHLGDFGVQFHMPEVILAEVKTERVQSQNLFVQTAEGGHKVHQKKIDGSVITDFVLAKPLTDQ